MVQPPCFNKSLPSTSACVYGAAREEPLWDASVGQEVASLKVGSHGILSKSRQLPSPG